MLDDLKPLDLDGLHALDTSELVQPWSAIYSTETYAEVLKLMPCPSPPPSRTPGRRR